MTDQYVVKRRKKQREAAAKKAAKESSAPPKLEKKKTVDDMGELNPNVRDFQVYSESVLTVDSNTLNYEVARLKSCAKLSSQIRRLSAFDWYNSLTVLVIPINSRSISFLPS